MKQQANTTNDRQNQILTFSTATSLDEVKARLPQPDTVKRVLRRACFLHMHEVTMADEPRTNMFHSLVGHSHPTNWKLIETLQVEANRIPSILIQSDRGNCQKKSTRRIKISVKTDYKE